jgi:hypothetical protein
LKKLLSEIIALDQWQGGKLTTTRVTYAQLDMLRKHYPAANQNDAMIQIDLNGKKIQLIKVGV